MIGLALGCLVLLSLGELCSCARVQTPFGMRNAECVVEVPSGTIVEEGDGGLHLTHTALGTWFHKTPSTCMSEQSGGNQPERSSGGNQSCNSPPCTCDSLPCNNWIDNAGFMLPEGSAFIGGMSSIYSVPGTPPSTTGPGQCLFYFIGAENTDGSPRSGQPPPSGRAILQPVLTYDPSGWCANSSTGWCFSSWYCCPKNLTVHSAYIQDVKAGEQYLGKFNLSEDKDNYVVTSTQIGAPERTTTLIAPRQGRRFNWADVTLEAYAINTCSEFAAGAMSFSEVRLWDDAGKTLSPTWLTTSNKPCKGVIAQTGASFTIEHDTTAN